MRTTILRIAAAMVVSGLAGLPLAEASAPPREPDLSDVLVVDSIDKAIASVPEQRQPASLRAPANLEVRDGFAARRTGVVQSTSQQAVPSIEDVRQAISRSGVFLAEVDTTAVMGARGDVVVSLSRETAINLSKMLRETALDRRTGLGLVDQDELRSVLGSTPRFESTAFVLEDRLVVMQTANIPFAAGSCDAVTPRASDRARARPLGFRGRLRSARLRQFLEQECFTVGEQREWRGQTLTLPVAEAAAVAPKGAGIGDQREVDLDVELAADVAAIRDELAALSPDADYVPGISVRDARALSDEALLALELNATERVVARLTVLPYGESVRAVQTQPGVVDPLSKFMVPIARERGEGSLPLRPLGEQLRGFIRASSPRLTAFDRRIRQTPAPIRIFTPRFEAPDAASRVRSPLDDAGGLGAQAQPAPPVLSQRYRTGEVLDVRYRTLLMGKTVARHFGDDYRASFGRNGRWHVGFEWWAGYGYGLRFPFELRTASTERFRSGGTIRDPARAPLNSESLEVEISVEGIARTRDGRSPYADAGLPRKEHFGDSEIFLTAYGGCRLYGRVPIVKGFNFTCPGTFSIPEGCDSRGCDPSPRVCENSNFCHHFIPRLQREPWSMASVTVPSDLHRLRVDLGVVRFGADPGVEAFATNTRLAMTAVALSGNFRSSGRNACTPDGTGLPRGELLAPGECRIVFESQRAPPAKLAVVPDRGRDASVRLADPRLDMSVGLSPFMEVYAVFDIKVWKKRWDWRLHLGQVNIDASFGAHAGAPEEFMIGQCKADGPVGADCSAATRRVAPGV